MFKNNLLIILFLLLFSSCGTVSRLALRGSAALMYDASNSIYKEGKWENFKNGTIANLKFIEGLYSIEPENEKILLTLIKGYTGYAYGVSETLYYSDLYSENDKTENLNMTLYYYSQAIRYAEKLLSIKGIKFKHLKQLIGAGKDISKYIDSRLSLNQLNLELVFYSAQAVGGMLNLNKSDINLLTLIPVIKGMFDWVCVNKPDINYGACGIFYGSYYASRPKMLGGDPVKGKEIFNKTMKKNPNNYLIKVGYIQNYIIPTLDESEYSKTKKKLALELKNFSKSLNWKEKSTNNINKDENLNLFNAIAEKRFEIIIRNEKNVF